MIWPRVVHVTGRSGTGSVWDFEMSSAPHHRSVPKSVDGGKTLKKIKWGLFVVLLYMKINNQKLLIKNKKF